MESDRARARFMRAVSDGARSGLRTALWLLAIMLPVSLLVSLLRWVGALDLIGAALEPLLSSMGLPGSASLVLVSGLFINLYSAIAVMSELALTLREVTILAIIGLIAHNFLVEIAVLGTTGSRPLRMIALRLIAGLLAGFALSRLLPAGMAEQAGSFVAIETASSATGSIGEVILAWAVRSSLLVVRIAVILLALMVGERLLNEYGVVRWLGKRLGGLMRLFGLPEQTAFLWVISNTLGLAYGAGVMRREVQSGALSREDGDLLNHHIAISHSLLEDTLLFVAIGVPALWIILPRIALAMVAVWERRVEQSIRERRRHRKQAGTRQHDQAKASVGEIKKR